jgi:4-hydroxythreonine-4-phosphate dehydrogenase
MTRRLGVSRIAVSLGCPCGVGPEVSLVAAAAERTSRLLLVGDVEAVRAAARGRGIDPRRIVRVTAPEEAWSLPRGVVAVWQPGRDLALRDRKPGAPTRASGAAQLAWVDAACDLAMRGEASALVTGPVSKHAIVESRAPGSAGFVGHTEYLQKRTHAAEVVMAFWSPALVTSLVTIHLPLARVPRAVTPALVARATFWLAWLLAQTAGRAPRVAVAALNPHAGEGGLLGREEETRIVPGIEQARARLRASRVPATIDGPIPAESAFRLAMAKRGPWDGVVAMYHDQATIPMKIAGFGDAVNVSLGLPIVRTSVDHGTAYDRAGTWTADASGMRAALGLAARLARSGEANGGPRAPTPAIRAETPKRRTRST